MPERKTVIHTRSPDETLALGRRLGEKLAPGHVVALVGPLGAGKTWFVKGVAQGAGVEDARDVTSPTFVLVNEYDARCRLYHLDTYRLSTSEELWALGFEEMCETGAVLVEWAEKMLDIFPNDTLRVDIEPTGETARTFSFCAVGPRSSRLLDAIRG